MSIQCPNCGHKLASIDNLNWEDFAFRLRIAMAVANVSFRQLSQVISVDQAAIHRVAKHGKPVNVGNFLLLSSWVEAMEARCSADVTRIEVVG